MSLSLSQQLLASSPNLAEEIYGAIDELTVRSALAQLSYGVRPEKLKLIYPDAVAKEAIARFNKVKEITEQINAKLNDQPCEQGGL